MNRIPTLAYCIIIITGAVQAQIESVVSSVDGQGIINWSSREIISKGTGIPNRDLPIVAQGPGALRAAQSAAFNNALKAVNSIVVNSTSTIQKYSTENRTFSLSIQEYIAHFPKKSSERHLSDGTVEITYEIPIDGTTGITGLLMGQNQPPQPPALSMVGSGRVKTTPVSGIIINCTGFAVKPAIQPKILDENKQELYSIRSVSMEWMYKYGMVGYAGTVEMAQQDVRIGRNPSIFKIKKVVGPLNTDVVVSNHEATIIRRTVENSRILSECRVLFVIDQNHSKSY